MMETCHLASQFEMKHLTLQILPRFEPGANFIVLRQLVPYRAYSLSFWFCLSVACYMIEFNISSSLVVPRRASSFPGIPAVDGLDVLVVLVVLFLKVVEQLAQPSGAAELVLGVERIRPGLTGAGVSVVLRRRRRDRIVLVQSAVYRWSHPRLVHPENVASVAR